MTEGALTSPSTTRHPLSPSPEKRSGQQSAGSSTVRVDLEHFALGPEPPALAWRYPACQALKAEASEPPRFGAFCSPPAP